MTTKRKSAFLLAAGLFLGAAVFPITAAMATGSRGDKVTICHRTNSNTNPYRQITVAESAVDGVGKGDHYGEHRGPVWDPTLKAQKIEWGDIIPPVAGVHEGQNWTAGGQAIYNDGCKPVPPVTTTTEGPTTTVPEVTTTLPPTTVPKPEPEPEPEPPVLIPPTVIVPDGPTPVVAEPNFTG